MPILLSSAFAWTGATIFVASLLFYLYSYLVTFGRPAAGGAWIAPAAFDLLLFSAFAFHHSLFARTAIRDAIRRAIPPRLERSSYTWVASVLFVVVCWLWRPVPGVVYRMEGLWWWLGAAVQSAGILFTYLGSSALDVFDLAGIRQLHAGRPPATTSPAPLKTSGAYRLVRHPIYLGWALFVFGTPTMTATRLIFAIISTAYLAIAIPWEERTLVEAFGAQYREYQRRVRWRMLPGVY